MEPANIKQFQELISTKDKEFYGALLEAQSSLGAVLKDAKNSYSGYLYTSSEAMIGAARKALHSAGLVVRRSHWSWQENQVISTFEISHPASGISKKDSANFPVFEQKGKPIDKALAAALTTSFSYWLRDLLLLPRTDDIDERDDKEYKPEKVTREDLLSLTDLVRKAQSPQDMTLKLTEKMKNDYGVVKGVDLNKKQFDEIRSWLKGQV